MSIERREEGKPSTVNIKFDKGTDQFNGKLVLKATITQEKENPISTIIKEKMLSPS